MGLGSMPGSGSMLDYCAHCCSAGHTSDEARERIPECHQNARKKNVYFRNIKYILPKKYTEFDPSLGKNKCLFTS